MDGPYPPVFGLTVGIIVHDLDDSGSVRKNYLADITYGTNNEFGFDYLRDNMKFNLQNCVQRGHNFAIVDEVDSILIDEARTPLIISGLERVDRTTLQSEQSDPAPGSGARSSGRQGAGREIHHRRFQS